LLIRKRSPTLMVVVLTSAAVAMTVPTLTMLLPSEAKLPAPGLVGLSVGLLNSAAVIICGLILLKTQYSELERSILLTAFSQAPDYLYIKDRDSRFVAVNENMVRLHRRGNTDQMSGLSDFDTMELSQAEGLYRGEQELMRTGTPLIDSFEQLGDRCFLASKVPVRDLDGRIIGLAGVTRDITERKTLERELQNSKNLLAHAMAGMSDGFAMFDSAGVLVFCNEQYRNAFPLSKDARVVGANIRDILRRIVQTHERLDIPQEGQEDWIEAASATLHCNKDEEIQLPNGEWRSLKTRLGEHGMAMVVVSDITAMKQAEHALRLSAQQLKTLAETDGLTGIINRRAFDEAFAREAARSARNNTPLSLLMIDIDRFKAYNDTYGHPQGDQCLRFISKCLSQSVKRPSDIVARYGGEEFVILLPETDQSGATLVAEEFALSLTQENIAHSGSEFGRVTASIGISSATGRILRAEPTRLLSLADAALYEAKSQGRNRSLCRQLTLARKAG
jgi:diguanylate cyclase (GGDEF)-like protein/PAS domain S-box-containing protein